MILLIKMCIRDSYSRFIRPGAVRLSVSAFDQTDALIPDGDTDQQGLMCSAYKNVDATYVMVVIICCAVAFY